MNDVIRELSSMFNKHFTRNQNYYGQIMYFFEKKEFNF